MYQGQFPKQKISFAQKKKKKFQWAKNCLDYFSQYRDSEYYQDDETSVYENFNLIEGNFDTTQLTSYLKKFSSVKDNQQYPLNVEHYDIITPKVNQLVGEEAKRPFRHSVIQVNSNAISSLQDKIEKEYKDFVLKQFSQKVSPEGNFDDVSQFNNLEEIDKYFKYEFRDNMEVTASQLLNFFKQKLRLKKVFTDGFKDYLACKREIYWVGLVNDEPTIRKVDPRQFSFELSYDNGEIEDASWACEWRYMTVSEVLDEYYDELTPDDIDKLEKQDYINNSNNNQHDFTSYERIPAKFNQFRMEGQTIVKVVRAEWVSMRKIAFLTYYEDGQMYEKIVDESYKPDEELGESIEFQWVNEKWEATRVGEDIYVNIKPHPIHQISVDNPSKVKLGYVGTTGTYSFIDLIKNWQALADATMANLKMRLMTAKGRMTRFDIAQLPKSEGIDIDKLLYYGEMTGILFYNSKEEGGTGNQVSNQPIDLTLSDEIQKFIQILGFIDDRVARVTGITPQREGSVSASETVGGVQRSIEQSSYVTETWFFDHEDTKKRVLERLLDEAKNAYIDGKQLAYVSNFDNARIILNIPELKFSNAEYGIFASDSSTDKEAIQILRQQAAAIIQSTNGDLKDLITVFKSDNLTEIESALSDAKRSRQQEEERIMQQQSQQAQALEQAKQQTEAMKQDREDKRNESDNITKLRIAELQLMNKSDDANRNGVSDALEYELETKKLDYEQNDKDKKHQLEEKKFEHQKDIDYKKLKLEEQEKMLQKSSKDKDNKK